MGHSLPLAEREYGDLLVPVLAAALAALDGYPCPQNQTLGRLTGLSVSQIDVAIARGIATGKLQREMRRRARRFIVLGDEGQTVAASGFSRPGGGPIPHAVIAKATAAAIAAGGPATGEEAAPRKKADGAPRAGRERCPMCNLPPNHAECRHGWDGSTTRAMRRDIAAAVAGEMGRAA